MIRKRFSSWRVAKVIGLTMAVLTWSAALFARLVGFPAAEAAVPPPEIVPDDASTTSTTVVQEQSAVPAMPEGGLFIIRGTRAEAPQPIVRRVVVQQAAPSQPAASQPPPKKTQSAGS